jgi:UDP-N-acetylmuramate: L-alanyl-gamma-D-glutamyl-meso-diaminopimelate ligase
MVFTDPQLLKVFLMEQNYHNSVLLMMSSGNYGGLDWEELKVKIAHF